MGKIDAQFHLTTSHLIKIVLARVARQVIHVVDRQATGHGRLIRAVTIGEGGVETDHGQVLGLQLSLDGLEGLTRERTFLYLLQLAGNLLAGIGHLLIVHCCIK